jgi:purine nucleosidase
MRLIIDTDPGVDDAHALMATLAHPDAEVGAIITVVGNVPLARTTANACTILDAMGADVPVYAGCAHPLIQESSWATEFHGKDGLGDAGLAPSTRAIEAEHGVNALVRIANESPGEWTLLAIGPLTNVAMATRLDPDLPKKFARLVIMGGAVRAMGNSTTTAEFNVLGDPEAAAIVFRTWPKLTLVSWETTMAHSFSAAQVDALLAVNSPRADFLRRISTRTLAAVERIIGERGMVEPDLLAAAVALEPCVVSHSDLRYVDIELAGTLTRGQTAVDWFGRTGRAPNVEIVTEMDTDRVWQMLRAAL